MLWPAALNSRLQPLAAPLILTVELPADAGALLSDLRRIHYPAGAARAPAHLTLFRHLPGPQVVALAADVRRLAAETPCPPVRLAGLASPDTAVAVRAESPALDGFRERLADWWGPLLTPGDAAPARLHVTLAAHLSETAARRLAGALAGRIAPMEFRARAVLLWQHAEPKWLPLVRLGFHR